MVKLADKYTCTGCTACASVCGKQVIRMVPDAEGFLMPQVEEDCCVECGLCSMVCPVVTGKKRDNLASPKAFALWSNPDRIYSSSGGAFSAFARLVLKQGGVVFGAAYDEELKVRHISINHVDDLEKLRGSKYVQSDLGETYKEVKRLLKQNIPVLYTGTPCQIAGLKSFLQKEYPKLLTLDLACHGVPSNAVFQSYLKKLRMKRGLQKLTSFEFRRRNGWGFSPSVSLDGKFRPIYDVDNLYMSAFDESALFRHCCYNCSYCTIPRVGDCSIADFWGIGRYGIPFKQNTLKGVSLVLVNNKHGEELLNDAQECFKEERTLKEALIENPNLRQPSPLHPSRDSIIKAFLAPNRSLESIDKEFHLVDRSLKGRIKKYATKWGVFDITKVVYNFYKSHI